jgi:FkbM family methyltransferase
MLSDVSRTQMYYALHRRWYARWPFDRGRHLPSALRRVFKPFVPVWVQLEPGIRMLLDPEDLVSRVILQTGNWETAAAAIRHHLTPGSTFVDVGAHIGYYSLNAAISVGPMGHVLAIEPDPDTSKKLAANVEASGAGVVQIESVACFDCETTLRLFAASPSNTGKGSLSEANSSEYAPVSVVHTVKARRLDAIIADAGLSRIDVLKIDVEGAEHLALKGAEDTLARYSPVLFVELEDDLLRRMHSSSAAVVSFLKSRGYSMVRTYDEANFEFRPSAEARPQ